MANSVIAPPSITVVSSLFNKALCTSSVSSLEALDYTSCLCTPLIFLGSWETPYHFPDPPNFPSPSPSPSPSLSVTQDNIDDYHLHDDDIDDIFNGTDRSECWQDNSDNCSQPGFANLQIGSILSLCPDNVRGILTSQAAIFFDSFPFEQLSCVSVNVNATPVRARPQFKPLTLSFIPTDYNPNPYATVVNSKGVVVGQVMSQTIVLSVSQLHDILKVDLFCVQIERTLLPTPSPTPSPSSLYTVPDLGLEMENGYFIPIENITHVDSFPKLGELSLFAGCFRGLNVIPDLNDDTDEQSSTMRVAAILRMEDYEDQDQLNTVSTVIMFSSGVIYGVAFIFSFAMVFLLEGLTILVGVQSILLLVIRSVYFFLVGFLVLPYHGELINLAMVEAPSFFYVGICGQLLTTLSFHVFGARQGVVPRKRVIASLFALFAVVWLSFAFIVFRLSFVDSTGAVDFGCDCRLANHITLPKDTAKRVRLYYKSVVAVLALFILILFGYLGRKKVFQQARSQFKVLLGVVGSLLVNSVFFLAYYILNKGTSYFALTLWFTELAPIVCLMVFFTFREGRMHLMMWRSRMSYKFEELSGRSNEEYETLN
eukprot:CAMPEP_0201514936 /NCGR_PEP_ID=MMETSP0161_2-20130828/6643_1 /ASSEMBLY_ACC=CAM_ASM_000251 /TAXON_ID=180227 /ORGANISM="Neoparamoeba aestuarina, Strain SoJaBio B1-5/56/2" /LENGTH=596 /DNA_ID=CAMNT_0047911627 /DNA_START=351 /DNA_END=2141 /DNA_ORIENTATION=+